jgi:hypothetical protein
MQGYNPYQPPVHPEVPPYAALGAPGEPLDWEIETALGVGWDRVKQWWPVLVFAPGLFAVISWVISYVCIEAGLQGLDSLISLFMGSFFGVGMIRMFLSAMRGEEPQFGQLFSGADRMFPMLGTQLLMGLAIGFGMIALIIPGIIVALGFSLAMFVCVDQKLGPIDSLKNSWAMMDGCKLKQLGFGFVCIFVAIVGLLALVVGLFVANAVIYAAMTWIYLRRRGEVVPEKLGQLR